MWGSPEMLSKEKVKRTKVRQQDYEGNVKTRDLFAKLSSRLSALFSLKKSVKEYQKRLSLLENASFDNRKAVSEALDYHARYPIVTLLQVKQSILTTGGGKVVVAAVLM